MVRAINRNDKNIFDSNRSNFIKNKIEVDKIGEGKVVKWLGDSVVRGIGRKPKES